MSAIEIDVTSRRKAAEIVRHFAAGLLTNDQMDDSLLPERSNVAINDILFFGVWPLYDDRHKHKLTGRYRLAPAQRTLVARIIVFLRTDLPYRWPISSARDLLTGLFTFGLCQPMDRKFRACGGDETVWPFFTGAEYQAALKHPPFLRGNQRAVI
jgi:hypothetical protein